MPGLGVLALNSRIVASGDSKLALANSSGFTLTGTDFSTTFDGPQGFFTWARAFSGSPWYLRPDGNKGIAGRKLTGANDGTQGNGGIAAAYPIEVSPLAPKIVVNEGGTNDFATQGSAAIIAAWDQRNAYARADGSRIIAIPITPRGPTTNALTTAQEADRLTINAYIASKEAPDLGVVDISGFDTTTMTTDQLHENTYGAIWEGQRIAQVPQRKGWLPSTDILAYYASSNLLGPTLGQFAGTGGTNASSARLTGPIPTSWSLGEYTGNAGLAGVSSLISRGGSLGNWWQIALSGTPTGTFAGPNQTLVAQASVSGLSIPSGTPVGLLCELEVDAGSARFAGVLVKVTFTGSGTTRGVTSFNNAPSGDFYPASAISGAVIRPIASLLNGPVDTVYLQIGLYFTGMGSATQVPFNATVRIGRLQVVRYDGL